jgi:putative transposase
MPRRPRINLAGHPQHVVQRGHNREACFFESKVPESISF